MNEVGRPIQTNYTLCELAEKASTVVDVMKDKEKEDSFEKQIGIEKYSSCSKLIRVTARIFFFSTAEFQCVIQKCI